jgi:hypothetical protein
MDIGEYNIMIDQVVEFIVDTENYYQVETTEKFQLREDKKYPWLQKLCFSVLRKLGAFSWDKCVEIERHSIKGTINYIKLIEEITFLKNADIKPSRILMGSEDYASLMSETISKHYFSYQTTYPSENKIYGLLIEIIPWMKGFLVMPDPPKPLRTLPNNF